MPRRPCRCAGLRLVRLAVVLAAAGLATVPASAQEPRDAPGPLWTEVPEAIVPFVAPPFRRPSAYRVYRVDEPRLLERLAEAPLEGQPGATPQPALLRLPLPDGKLRRFHVWESPVMEQDLQAKFPEVRTYIAQGLDDPTASGRLDRTPAGFHGMILAGEDTFFIDPYQPGDTLHYVAYWRRDMVTGPEDFRCLVQGSGQAPGTTIIPNPPSGDRLRTYRIAIAATGEYTAFHGGTVPLALAAINTTLNRVTGIYEREVAIRMVLIGNDTNIIYTNAATDPYTNGNPGAMIGENQANVNAVIGAANYDIGHVVGTNSGGLASLGVVCNNGSKARGVTGSGAPIGDAFDVDYVAHEIGHQFGGNHTFNGTTSNCGGGNRNGGTAYEPGSGTTIMAYAGICAAENVQANSDPQFHTVSFDEITAFRDAGGACGAQTVTGNRAPAVNAGPDFTIPTGTPFVLTATGSDPDGDALTFSWEQFDLGNASPPPNNANGPLYRSRPPTVSPARTLPRLPDILSGAPTPWEILPTVNRTATFRATARDNRAGGGGVDYDSMVVTFAGAPFRVTAPNGGESLRCGCGTTVTWDVGGGGVAPTVNIRLSLDGGNTFPTVLAAGTPNDGSEAVTLPCTPSATARVKVEGAGNIFFDVSNGNFTLSNVPPAIALNVTAGSVDASCQRLVTWTATVDDDCRVNAADVTSAVVLTTGNAVLGVPTINVVQTDPDTVTVNGSVLVSALTSSPATVRVTVSGADNCANAVQQVRLADVSDDLAPNLTCPAPISLECTTPGGVPASDPRLVPFFSGAVATDNCDPDPVITNNAPAFFPLGTTPVTFTATDDSANSSMCSSNVSVVDTTPPVIQVSVSPDVLWPPNHRLVDITAGVTVADICDPAPTFVLTSITSNEPDNGTGDGDTAGDIRGAALGTPDLHFRLRAERSGKGEGRVYTIVYTASDASGNTATGTAEVRVPHSRGRDRGAAAGDARR